MASWAAKQGVAGEEGGRRVPAEGGGSGGGAILKATCGLRISSMVRLVGRAAAEVARGWGLAAP